MINAADTRAYVMNLVTRDVSVIDTATNAVTIATFDSAPASTALPITFS